jgi:co-chaperonin GroES (HSP10)
MEVGVGDRVIYTKYSGTETQPGDEELLILGADDVLTRFPEAKIMLTIGG